MVLPFASEEYLKKLVKYQENVSVRNNAQMPSSLYVRESSKKDVTASIGQRGKVRLEYEETAIVLKLL